MSLGRGDRALGWAGGSLPAALQSALAQAAEIICLLRDFGFGEQRLSPTDYHMGPVTMMILPAFANILSPNIGGWIHNVRLSKGRVEKTVSQVNDLRGSRGAFSSKLSPTDCLMAEFPALTLNPSLCGRLWGHYIPSLRL